MKAFILIDDDFDRKIGLNRDIKDSVYLSRISTTQAALLYEEIKLYEGPPKVTFHQEFKTDCSSYYALDYLLASFLAI